ncbi:hypothetical protein E3N88_27803 [Mikania micrantha]|uniref:EF-hand domain-containing protein n=1 Tax=Mikania micrantha TaxID=192012 RepID=A0A5N6N0P3_9ASTR|nr:hypothetical protein E3N88_27803 [Mikania micrantha]
MTLPPPTTAPNHQRQRITTTPPPETTLPKPFPTTANSCPHSPPPRFDRLPQHCCHQRQRLTTTAGNHSACDILFTTVAVTITTQTLPYHNKLLPQPHPTEDRVYHNLPPATTHRLDETIAAADVDGHGTIDYDEFITTTMHLNRMDREEHFYTTF